MLSPKGLNIGLQLRTEGAVIVEAGNTTIDLKTGYIEELLSQEVLTLLALVLFAQIDSSCLLSGALYL